MSSLLVKVLGSVLKFLLRVLLLVVTGEWVDLEKFAKSVRPGEPGRPSVDTQTPDRASLVRRIEELRVRQPGDTRPDRAHFEAFARDFGAPLEEHLREQGVGLRKRTFVALTRVEAADESAMRDVRQHTRYWPLPLQAGASTTLSGYLAAARERSRALAEDAPGLLHKVRREHEWPAYLRLSGLEQPEFLRGAFGVWLAPLLAEILLTLQLGPGYAHWLLRGFDATRFGSRADPPASTAVQRPPANNLLSEELPPLLRLYAALGTLEFLGYVQDAERIELAVTKRLGDEPELVLAANSAGTQPPSLPHELWRSELKATLGSILEEAQPAFGGETLLDAPGIAFLHGEHARALRLAAALGQGANDSAREQSEAAARDWLAAALLASVQGNLREEEVVRRLRRALGGQAAARGEPSVPAVQPGTQGVSTARALRTMLRDPRAIRDAVALGTVLSPRAKSPGKGVRRPLGR